MYLVTYCCHQLVRATFLELVRRVCRWPADPSHASSDEWPDEATREVYDHAFNFLADDSLPTDPDGELWVVPDFIFRGQGFAPTADPVPFEIFVQHLSLEKHTTGATSSRSSKSASKIPQHVKDKILEEFPWMARATIEKALEEDPAEEQPDPDLAAKKPEFTDEVAEEHVLGAFERLKEIREMHDEGDEIEEVTYRHLYWRILRSKWTAKHKSVAADCANQFARQHARQWCSLFSWPVQKGFAFNMYGQFESVQLAKAWTRKANFLFARCGWMMGGPATTSTRRSS